MTRGDMSHWLQQHHLLPESHWPPKGTWFIDFLKTTWLLVVLLVMGAMALITAVLVAWPALSYLGAKLFS